MSLTKLDIKAMRNADTLVFFHNVEYGGIWGSWVKAMKDGDKSSTGFGQEHWVRLDTSIRSYDDSIKGCEPGDLVGSVVLLSPNLRLEVTTWLKVLREGDDLVVEFLVGNNTPVLDKAGLSKDEAWLTVKRPSPVTSDRHAVGKYFLDNYIVPVGPTARMVRRVLVRR